MMEPEKTPLGFLPLTVEELLRLYEGSKMDKLPVGSQVRQMVAEIRHHRIAVTALVDSLRSLIAVSSGQPMAGFEAEQRIKDAFVAIKFANGKDA